MAKKKTGKSRSQHIREYLQTNPGATPSQIVKGLAAIGVKVSSGLASNVKYHVSAPKASRKKRKKTARKKVARGRAARKRAARGRRAAGLTAQDLFEAKKLVDDLGGVAAARKALDALEKLK